jgi:DNA-binding MarR family transcriptional regulator
MHDNGGTPQQLFNDPRLLTVGLIFEAHAGIRAAVEPELERHGLTGSAFEVLVRLSRAPDQRLRMTDLAIQSTLSNSGLTRVVDRLLAAQLVERAQHEADRRVFYAVLTPAGEDHLLRALPSHLVTIDRIITQVLTPEEVEAFEASLRKIRDVVVPHRAPLKEPEAAPDLPTVLEPGS